MTRPNAWQPIAPTEIGWYWHHDGDVMKPLFVFPRPGHSYLAVYDDPNPTTGKRQFRMVAKMRGHWSRIMPPPPPPGAAPVEGET